MATRFIICGYGLFLAAHLALAANGEDLGQRYPATLRYSERQQGHEWMCSDQDVWRLKSFEFAQGEGFHVKVAGATVVFGRKGSNVLWAAVFPAKPGRILRASNGQGERVNSIWLRAHPGRVGELFPPNTVVGQGDAKFIERAKQLAAHKLSSCWQSGGRPMIPFRSSVTMDMETVEGARRFYSIDTVKKTTEYVAAFRNRGLTSTKSVDWKAALEIFDDVWGAFDREYAMFGIKPSVDWHQLRKEFRPLAAKATDTHDLARIIASMLSRLKDLHVFVTVDGSLVPGYRRDRHLNANPAALKKLIGSVTKADRGLSWAVTDDGVGYVSIDNLTNSNLPHVFSEILSELSDTRGLVLDLRYNGGGGEPIAKRIAGFFVDKERTYAKNQYRNGLRHSDLGPVLERKVAPQGAWHYAGPVVVLQGQKTMSSAEAFALMMAVCPQVVTMGDRTAGSSGNPRRLDAGAGIVVNLPLWLALDAEGKPFETIGIKPDRLITTSADDFDDGQDPVLAAALEHLRNIKTSKDGVLLSRPKTRRNE